MNEERVRTEEEDRATEVDVARARGGQDSRSGEGYWIPASGEPLVVRQNVIWGRC